jgi:hypothetical protein
MAQVQALCFELEVKSDEHPDDAMSRVEDITDKAKISDSQKEELDALQRITFLRLIMPQEPMYFYVTEGTINPKSPYEALALAKKYLRVRGHETGYVNKLVQKKFDAYGIKPNPDASATPVKSDVTVDARVSAVEFEKLRKRVEKLSNPAGSASTQHELSIDARYLPTTTQPEDWYKKIAATINEHERKQRIIHSELTKMVEGVRNAGQYRQQGADGGAQTASAPSQPQSYRNQYPKQSYSKPKAYDRSKGKAANNRKSKKSGGTVINFYGAADMVRPDDDSDEDDESDAHQSDPAPDVSQE